MISSSFYIPEDAWIYDLSCEIVPTNEELVKNVQYQYIHGVETIVDQASRREIFRLSGNPLVTRIETDDYGLCFRIQSKLPGKEMTTMYKVDEENGYVHKISHLFLRHTDSIDGIYILNGSRESYINILRYLKDVRSNSTKNLIVKLNDHWVPFISVEPEDLLPEEILPE